MKVGLSQMSLRARETLKHSALLLSYIYGVFLSAPRARRDICDMAPIASVAGGQKYPRPFCRTGLVETFLVKTGPRCLT